MSNRKQKALAWAAAVLLALLPAAGAPASAPSWIGVQENPTGSPQIITQTQPPQLNINWGATPSPAPTAAAPSDAWTGISAWLNQRMATRSGPGTKYTEELGTLPQTTVITLYRQEQGSVPWGLVEFEYQGGLYRAYTGMKRIEASAVAPWTTEEPSYTYLVQTVTPHYGPGTQYVPKDHKLYQGASVAVYGQEQGYALVEYPYPPDPSQWVRSWVPVEALAGW